MEIFVVVIASVCPYDQACTRDNLADMILFLFGWNIIWVNISDKLHHGYRISFNMDIIDQNDFEPWDVK